MHELKVTLIFI